MATLREELYKIVDSLSPDSLGHLKDYAEYLQAKERAEAKSEEIIRQTREFYAAPIQAAAAGLTDEKVNQRIDKAVEEIRGEDT